MPDRGQRLDKWLWYARLVKTRSQGERLVEGGKIRVNRLRVLKPGKTVDVGDVVTATVRGHVRVLKILDAGARRGPASEARALYEDLSLPTPSREPGAAPDLAASTPPPLREPGAGRPTKRERRRLEAWMAPGDREEG